MMAEKLLKMGGFDPSGNAKGFSVDADGSLNVAGQIQDVLVGEVVEPYGPNYSGVAAVLGRRVLAARTLETLSVNPYFIGSFGNFLYFVRGASSAGGSPYVEITNLNLAIVDRLQLTDNVRNEASFLLREVYIQDRYLVHGVPESAEFPTARFKVYDLESKNIVFTAETTASARYDISTSLVFDDKLAYWDGKNKIFLRDLASGAEIANVDIDTDVLVPNGFESGKAYRVLITQNKKYIAGFIRVAGSGNTLSGYGQLAFLIDKESFSVVNPNILGEWAGLVQLSYLDDDNLLYYHSHGKDHLKTWDINKDQSSLDIPLPHVTGSIYLEDGILIKRTSPRFHESYVLQGHTFTPIDTGGRSFAGMKDSLGRFVGTGDAKSVLVLSGELELKGYRVV